DHQGDPALRQSHRMDVEGRKPWVEAVPDLILDPKDILIQGSVIDAHDLGGSAVSVFANTDDDVAAVRVGERADVRQQLLHAALAGIRESQFEIETPSFRLAALHERVQVGGGNLVERTINHAL